MAGRAVNPNRVNAFLNNRAADVRWVYADSSAKGAISLAPPIDRVVGEGLQDLGGYFVNIGNPCKGHEVEQLASSRFGKYEAIRHRNRPTYGLQFHPEVSGSHGLTILGNFAA